MNRELSQVEKEILEESIIEMGYRLDTLLIEDQQLRTEMLKEQEQMIHDLEILNKRLAQELKCEKKMRKLGEFLAY